MSQSPTHERETTHQKLRQDDPAPTGRSAALTPVQQRQAAALALWRLRTPVLAFGWDADWGIDPALVDSLRRPGPAR
ncbi:hypothetical protein ACFYS8_15325 [Kitasatospora sp. NPDC004615]|uniref:hypothetical protein n=1 Tax=Kitasatospora sp. NPDC004615 TaxID=3364017 RepID=UPI00367DCE10